mgnify:CR=1 FL=1
MISDYIPYGKENRISRKRLSEISGVPDRELRDLIKRENKLLIKEHKAPVISSSGVSGYWRTDDKDEIIRHCKEEERRSNSIRKNILPFYEMIYSTASYTMVRAHVRKKHKSELDGQVEIHQGEENGWLHKTTP